MMNGTDNNNSAGWLAAKQYLRSLRRAPLPPFFQGRMNARLRQAANDTASFFYRFLVPAGAFAALVFSAWAWLAFSDTELLHPVDEILLGRHGMTNILLNARNSAQFHLIDQETL